jgi:hypothetical protein
MLALFACAVQAFRMVQDPRLATSARAIGEVFDRAIENDIVGRSRGIAVLECLQIVGARTITGIGSQG